MTNYMKAFLFCFFIVASLCQNMEFHAFRYSNGSLKIANESTLTPHGSVFFEKQGNTKALEIVGLDPVSKTSFILVGGRRIHLGANVSETFECVGGAWGYDDPGRMTGTITLSGSWENATVDADCVNSYGDHWIFKGMASKTEHIFYPPIEAGQRAKDLIGQESEKYHAPHVILYAILDYPYFEVRCRDMLDKRFPEANKTEPGVLVVGKDGQHCGILDNEGTKFIHSNPSSRRVSYDALTSIERYFPKGVTYKHYPKDPLLPRKEIRRFLNLIH